MFYISKVKTFFVWSHTLKHRIKRLRHGNLSSIHFDVLCIILAKADNSVRFDEYFTFLFFNTFLIIYRLCKYPLLDSTARS